MKRAADVDGYDVAIVGAGVVGCALARRFALDGQRVVVLEKALDVLDGASKGNSAILHTGFDAPPGTVEADCIRAGYREFMAIRERLGLPVMETGALVIAWDEAQAAQLPALMDAARANGVDDVAPLTADETRALEPQLGPGVRASFRVPGEFIIDPWSTPHAYLLQAIENGAQLKRDCEVLEGARDGAGWLLHTTRGPLRAGLVVSAAGLYGDRVEERLLGQASFEVRPRKGQFVVFDKSAFSLARHILLPVPTPITKGVVVCRTVWGNLLVGPTAEEQTARDRAPLSETALQALKQRGEEILPALREHDVTAIYAGLRPATETKAYRIRFDERERFVSVGGIRSTGLSAALGIAQHVVKLTEGALAAEPVAKPSWPTVPNISEALPRDWQRAGHGGIVCHCELVTRREIMAALEGPLAAQSLAGLKRRTRATMGRCQGFYCAAEISEMCAGKLAPLPEQPVGV